MKRLAAVLGGFCCGVAGVVAVACFSERGAGPVNSLAECNVPVSVIDSKHFIIAINNFGFHSDSIAVPVGATVTWVNCEPTGTEPHTTTSDPSGAVWDSPELSPGDRFSHTFPAPGAFPYHCTPHPFMTGKVVVQ
jgi:plastocyanin